MALIDGVVKLLPVCKDDPPVALLYQLIVPLLALAPKVTVPASHLDKGVVPVIVGGAHELYKLVTSVWVNTRLQIPMSSIFPFHLSCDGEAFAPIVKGLE